MDVILLPGGALRASVWDPEVRDTVMREVTDELPYFLRSAIRLHDQVTLRDLLLLAEKHRDFLLPLFTDLLDDFVEEVKRPAEHSDLCDLDYLEICWECYSEGRRFDLQPVLVGRNQDDPQVYSVEAVPTNAMGHLPVLLRTDFRLRLPSGKPGRGEIILPDEAAFPVRRELRRDFLLFDVFDGVLAEITVHGDPGERDRWWREIGSRELDQTEGAEEE
ncbi:MAG: hypothetical protein ACRDGR_10320 [bacterium]